MKAIIIDDERKARVLLRTLVEENCKEITSCHEAEDLMSGIEIIKAEKPEIIFLDIEMPEYSGLDILDFLKPSEINFEIIFTTAYSEYALQAFQLSAIDYLLKPMRPTQVIAAVKKAAASQSKSQLNTRLDALKNSLAHGSFTKIALPVNDGIKFLDFDDIVMMEANGMYTRIATTKEPEILISKPLKYFINALLDVPYFYRPHRSFLINLKFISQYVKSDGGYLVMDNNKMVSISKDKRDEFLEIVKSF